jgi:hypothetical protein
MTRVIELWAWLGRPALKGKKKREALMDEWPWSPRVFDVRVCSCFAPLPPKARRRVDGAPIIAVPRCWLLHGPVPCEVSRRPGSATVPAFMVEGGGGAGCWCWLAGDDEGEESGVTEPRGMKQTATCGWPRNRAPVWDKTLT